MLCWLHFSQLGANLAIWRPACLHLTESPEDLVHLLGVCTNLRKPSVPLCCQAGACSAFLTALEVCPNLAKSVAQLPALNSVAYDIHCRATVALLSLIKEGLCHVVLAAHSAASCLAIQGPSACD